MADQKPNAAVDRAWLNEILASEQLRARVLASAMTILLVIVSLSVLLLHEEMRRFTVKPVPYALPLVIMGPFVLYEFLLIRVIGRIRRGRFRLLPYARYANALIETTLPTVIMLVVGRYASAEVAFNTWPSYLYFIFILASTLRLNFALPAFTGVSAATQYLLLAWIELPIAIAADDVMLTPMYHASKAAVMLLAGAVAGLVALRLRGMLSRAMREVEARARVVNLFGQHVSPAVADRLMERPTEMSGETREVCVMFLDIRDFTANARSRSPAEVVEFLNNAFAFMIEAVDRHGGIINKFLGDGFMAVFGAPIEDREAARHATLSAREILAEIDRRGLADGAWPMRVGIGLHLGQAVTGNVGSPRRKEFTVIGDTVNLAARLEQLNKEYGTRLLVSDAVAQALGSSLSGAAPIGEVNIRGYEAKLRVWRLD